MSGKRRHRPRASFIGITEEKCRMILPSTHLLEASDVPKSGKQTINFITVFRFCCISITVFDLIFSKKHKHEKSNIAVNTEYQILSNF